jgi:O-antigen/teichoic acid export membrane protein
MSLYVYISFFDFGITKPIYANLREKYIQGAIIKVNSEIWIGLILTLLVLIISSLFFPLYINLIGNKDLGLILPLIVLLFSFTFFNFFLKALLDALDEYFFYDLYDFIRKLLLVFFTLLLIWNLEIKIYFVLLVCVTFMLTIICLIKIKKLGFSISYPGINTMNNVRKKYWLDGIANMTYSISDLFINNAGIVIIPIILDAKGVLIYQVYIKLYRGVSAVYRALIDANIPNLTKWYLIKSERKLLISYFGQRLLFNLIILALALTVFSMFGDRIFLYLIGDNLNGVNLNLLYVSLIILAIGNYIQHVSCVFLLSTGSNYKFLRKISFHYLIINILFYLICWFNQVQLNYIILFSAILLFSSGVNYYIKLKKIIK